MGTTRTAGQSGADRGRHALESVTIAVLVMLDNLYHGRLHLSRRVWNHDRGVTWLHANATPSPSWSAGRVSRRPRSTTTCGLGSSRLPTARPRTASCTTNATPWPCGWSGSSVTAG